MYNKQWKILMGKLIILVLVLVVLSSKGLNLRVVNENKYMYFTNIGQYFFNM